VGREGKVVPSLATQQKNRDEGEKKKNKLVSFHRDKKKSPKLTDQRLEGKEGKPIINRLAKEITRGGKKVLAKEKGSFITHQI